ncbi:MAG TPA: cytochrome c oxidase subunit II [Caulobacteraceae bacterium]|jgi:cytochrome c oxidase subunit 2|nr:cytochrome c oxidase subunit II [Caulobacteraceae bacterium]
MSASLPFWPVEASAHAAKVDGLFLAFSALVVALTIPVFVLMLAYSIKYRRGSSADRSHRPSQNVLIETSWTVIPFLLTLGFFAYAAVLYFDLGRPPADSLVIDVVGKQWMWKFEHPGGQREIDDVHVPVGRDVELRMTSQDVIHSFFVPALRIKQDVLPGRYTTMWFNADRPGTYDLRCSQFCGLDHSEMIGRVMVLSQPAYAAWLQRAGTSGALADQGKALFQSLGCGGCHEGQSAVRAPSLEGLYGRPVPLQDGRVVTADDQYLRDSILDPNRDVVAGYQPQMPTFQGQVSEDDLVKLIAYLKSLGPRGKEHAP